MFFIVGLVALAIYGLLVFYVSRSCWLLLKRSWPAWVKYAYIAIIILLSCSFILGRIGEGSVMFQVLGAYWMAAFCILLLILPFVHLALWLLRLFKYSGAAATKGAGIIVLAVFIGLISFGSWNAYQPVVREYHIEIDKANPAVQELNIVMASDMHFGQLSGAKHAKRLVEQVNLLEPDLVLFPGDLVDDQIEPYINKGIDRILTDISAKYGVFASLGNHDRYAGEMQEFIEILEQGGMKVLYDEAVIIEDSFAIIGRKDRIEQDRKPLSELIQNLDRSKPLILLEHQPYDLDLAEAEGIDLMLSGHTHHGQIAPANLITGWLFENDWGYLKKGNMHSIVSSGYGFWGPLIRLGSRSEIVHIHVKFNGASND